MATTFRTITYTEFNPGKKKAILFIPSASQGEFIPMELIKSLPKDRSIIYIHSGYYGNSKSDKKTQSLYSQTTFVKTLHDLIDSLGFTKVTILGGSVGAIHAIELYKHDPDRFDALILGAPAFRKTKPISNFFMLSFVNLFLLLNPDLMFSIFLRILSVLPKHKGLYIEMSRVLNQLGARSYLLCLREIVLYSKNKITIENIIKEKGIIFLGSKDSTFNLLCDKELCEKTKCIELETGHGVFSDKSFINSYTSLQGN